MSEPAPEPNAFLAEAESAPSPQLVLLTGGRGQGKTQWCLTVCQAALSRGWTVAGVVSPAVISGGEKTGIDVLDVACGECRRLARRPSPDEKGTAGLGWRFDEAALRWGDGLLQHAPPCDVLFVDELGPLEFRGLGGFSSGFAAVASRHYRRAIVVVRPELMGTALARWPDVRRVYRVGTLELVA